MMSELLRFFQDASRSGVYRTARADDIRQAASGSGNRVATIAYGAKPVLLKNIATALEFPDWFGENWDALEDCLSDLSWRKATGHSLLFEGAEVDDDFGILVEVLRSVAGSWAARGTPFFAVFIDPAGALPLPEPGGPK
ncbi:MAG TPA: barstar family protein [Burkholderiales bacterium]|nr:barstar family protein [Burkholderiales bacterium]